jgi:hypothetical protein
MLSTVVVILAILSYVVGVDRPARMFDQYVSTSSTTSTISTSTICFVTSNAAPTECKRRRRAVVDNNPREEGDVEDINPSSIIER